MASHHYDDEENKVSNFKINAKPSYDELQKAFHEEYLSLFINCSQKKKKNFISRK